MPRGFLILVVGPSGAGKDTLIAAARERLAGRGFSFPRRVITRGGEAGAAEDHIPATTAEFETAERSGSFALSWRAHGVAYAIPSGIAADLAQGVNVVVNVSRTVVAEARTALSPVRVIEITAAPDVLRQRLTARARQSDDVDARSARTVAVAPDVTIVNDGNLQTAVEAFIAALTG